MTRITPEFDQRVADWLEDDPGPAPSQVAVTVLAALPLIRQRRRGWFRAGGRTLDMPNAVRPLAAIALVAVVAIGTLTLLARPPGFGGPGGSPSPSPLPTASPIATQTAVSVGTVTLTDTGCTWTGNPGVITAARAPVIGRATFVNDTDTFGNFGIYRLADGRTWEEGVAWVVRENDFLHGGPSQPPHDFAIDVGNVDATERGEYPGTLLLGAGIHGIVCSSNEPPPGAIFAVYLVGPLEIVGQP